MSEETIENIIKLDSNFAATFVDHHLLPFKKYYFYPKKSNNLYISYTLGPQLKNLNTYFTLDL